VKGSSVLVGNVPSGIYYSRKEGYVIEDTRVHILSASAETKGEVHTPGLLASLKMLRERERSQEFEYGLQISDLSSCY
jgi:hypothetical protein